MTIAKIISKLKNIVILIPITIFAIYMLICINKINVEAELFRLQKLVPSSTKTQQHNQQHNKQYISLSSHKHNHEQPLSTIFYIALLKRNALFLKQYSH